MKRIRAGVAGIWDFIVGDDWVTAAGVVAALGLTALVSGERGAWLVMPLAVVFLLTLSIWREARKAHRR
jgi:hypothetical protein